MISGKSKVCGVMAYPVEHSMSPLMHNYTRKRQEQISSMYRLRWSRDVWKKR